MTADGRTAVGGGFGIFPDRFNDDIVLQMVELPPLVPSPTANYTTIRRAAVDAAQPQPGDCALPQSGLQTTAESRTGASACSAISASSWWADIGFVGSVRNAGCCRRGRHKGTRAVWRELPAVEPRSDHGRPAAANFLGPIVATATSSSTAGLTGFSDYRALQTPR